MSLINLDYVRMDTGVKIAMQQFGMADHSGPSGRGWSTYATLQRCPQQYKLRILDGMQGPEGKGRAIGSAYHALLAVFYQLQVSPEFFVGKTVDGFIELLYNTEVSAEFVAEAVRLFRAYLANYEVDYLTPKFVELRTEDVNGNSCRYDLVATVEDDNSDVTKGLWIVEHKTASVFDQYSLSGWFADGEIIGEMMVWKNSDAERLWGPINGVIVNIVGKQKQPKFARVVVPYQQHLIDSHIRDLRAWRAQAQIYGAHEYWPRSRSACVTKFGPCEFFDHCLEEENTCGK